MNENTLKNLMFSSKNTECGTPVQFFKRLDRLFGFCLDVCASEKNHKCASYYTLQDNGLQKPWTFRNWMNPPYGKEIGKWCERADRESRENGSLTVALLPARTDTRWFSDYCSRWHFVYVTGRLHFDVGDGSGGSAPFPSIV